MKSSYDQATDSLYIHLGDGASVESVELTDGLVVDHDLNGVEVGIDAQHASQRADFDETLHIRLSDKPIVREMSTDWQTNISYAEDGTIVEIVLLDTLKSGCYHLSSEIMSASRVTANSPKQRTPC